MVLNSLTHFDTSLGISTGGSSRSIASSLLSSIFNPKVFSNSEAFSDRALTSFLILRKSNFILKGPGTFPGSTTAGSCWGSSTGCSGLIGFDSVSGDVNSGGGVLADDDFDLEN